MTLLDHYQQFLQLILARRGSVHSIGSYKSSIRQFLLWLDHTHAIRTAYQLQPHHLHAYQAHLHQHRTVKGLPIKATTINRRVSGARAFLIWLYDIQVIPRPIHQYLHYLKEPQLLPTSVLDHRQITALLAAIDTTTAAGLRDRAIVELLYTTGIRIGELERITIHDVDLANAAIRITGKGAKQRLVPIGRTALRHLTGYIRAVRPFLPGAATQDNLFLNTAGRPLSGHRIRAYIHAHAERARITVNVTPHTFRRSCTTELIRADANLYHVKQLLGHETLNTLRHYVKLNINDLRRTHAKCHPRERDQ